MEKSLIHKLFDTLDNWRNLPAYQLERRVDIFFAVYLADILEKKFGANIDILIPEFPVRIGSIYPDKKLSNPNLSFKIDYLAVDQVQKTVYLVELKTDDGSRRDKQDWYLRKAKELNIIGLTDGILKIYQATSSKQKYANLLSLLSSLGWVNSDRTLNIASDYNISIVYIQPNKKEGETSIVISFDDIIGFLSDKNDDFTKRFAKSLELWKVNPNNTLAE